MGKTFVVGDIHGCYNEFLELLEQMNVQEEDMIVSLGDIVDRGSKSVEVYNFFENRPNSMVLMGNHERKHLRNILSYSQEIVKVQFGEEYKHFVKWTKSLPYFYETEDVIIVHAFFEHDKSIHEQKENVLCGSTAGSRYLEEKYKEGTYWNEYYQGEKPIIYGHHVVGDDVKILNNTYGIDTGACHGGKLTAIELPNFTIHQVDVTTDYWKQNQQKWQVPVLKAKIWKKMPFEKIHEEIQKLTYKTEEDVVQFLKELSKWVNDLEKQLPLIFEKLQQKAIELNTEFGDHFNKEVSKLPYKTFIFQAKSNRLEFDYVQKSLNTPEKIMDLMKNLEM